MELKAAARILMDESTGHPELRRTAQYVHDEYAAGRTVEHDTLVALLGDAAVAGVLTSYRERDPQGHEDMIVTLVREADRVSPDPVLV
ncbi:MAG: hypothetical protein GEV10_24390 [Streptosporangiales bacterium]|nr:hypothetical protein [Streptosporangiales bacterium]